ncbi:MAG TPA: DinB family protein, partial [Candidatus Limnocylindrales bacterium]|nr:DinB family protein [Candidatus Limnocylindrales bacterium]
LLAALGDLQPEQLALRTAAHEWAIWQIASHMAGSRAYWFHDVLGEGDESLRNMFRVESTAVPDLPLADAGWEDDETHPRAASEIVDAFERTWTMIDECLRRWTLDDLALGFSRDGYEGTSTRAWVIWHLIEHEGHHGGEISLILGSNGLPGLDI